MITKFKLLVHQSTGQQYEDLFVKIMVYADDRFQPVRPHGKIGDRGNDGWNPDYGRYYQVYAPENLPNNTEIAIKKFKDDYKKLKSYWTNICEIKEFIFVVNDKFKGVSPHLSNAIADLKKDNKLVNAEIMLANDLEKLFSTLSDEHKNQIILTNSGKVNAWQLFNLYKNISDAKNYFCEFENNNLSYFIYPQEAFDATYNFLKNASYNYHNLGVGNDYINKGLNELIDDFKKLSWKEMELKSFNILSRMSLEFTEQNRIIKLSSTYSELVICSALGVNYAVEIENFRNALSNFLGHDDSYVTSKLNKISQDTKYVHGNIYSVEESVNNPNYGMLVNLYKRLKFLV